MAKDKKVKEKGAKKTKKGESAMLAKLLMSSGGVVAVFAIALAFSQRQGKNEGVPVPAASSSQKSVVEESSIPGCQRISHPGGVRDIPMEKMFGRIADEGWAAQYEPKVLSRDPWVIYFDKFATPEQADALVQAVADAGHKFQESTELQAGKSTRRVSENVFCQSQKCVNDKRVLTIHEIVTNITGLPLPNQELIQLLKYGTGQYYVTHQDTSNDYGQAVHGHRIYTGFLYLSDLPPGGGGETEWPAIDLRVAPKKGAAVIWANVQVNNPRIEDLRTNHQGLPVKNNSDGSTNLKLACNLWMYGYDWRGPWGKGCMNRNAGF